jgi:hypothetical protein|tara:strand:+ start:293 stop:868 length:576 start_codon:yes stop_codon:yes gene_type:complete
MTDTSKEFYYIKSDDDFDAYFINASINIPIDHSTTLIRDCVAQHEQRIEKVEPRKHFPTIKINQYEHFPLYDRLFSCFVELAKKHLKFEIHPRSGRNCWLFHSDKDFQCNEGIHNHKSKTIVAVFYLYVPPIESESKEGNIIFYDDNEKELFDYKPVMNDIIIFPGYLNHEVIPYKGEEPRMSLVMELECY